MFFEVFLDYFLDIFYSPFVRSKIFKQLVFKGKLLLRTHKRNAEPVGNHNLQFIIRAHEMKQEGLRVSPCLFLLFLMQDFECFVRHQIGYVQIPSFGSLVLNARSQIVAVLRSQKVVLTNQSNPIKISSANIMAPANV